MSRGDKQGKEKKKPKQDGTKIPHQSAYQASKNASTTAPLKIRNK